ncbi:MAG: hypothetical protein JOY82_26330 [Streptosporangiaceae bacterium]|nr:hypothetical protein [Streptosporangiaceae bacterium]
MVTPNLRIRGYAVKDTSGFARLSLRFLTVVDVEGYSRRSTSEQSKVQDDLESAMSEAAARAGLDRRRWYLQPCGDGELAVLPASADGLSLVADYPRTLALILGEINRSYAPVSRLRIRMAIHHGGVAPGRFGPVGAAPITVSRLADAQVLRQELRRRNDIDVALIVSATVYEEIVRSRFHDLEPEAFSRTIIRTKGTTFIGYLFKGCFPLQERSVSTVTSRNASAQPTALPTESSIPSLVAKKPG